MEFLAAEYPDLRPAAAEQVRALVDGGVEQARLTWREPR